MIIAQFIQRQALDVKSSGDSRQRVDAYFVSFKCPPDKLNHGPGDHEWVCRFEVPRGVPFQMRNFPSKEAAHAVQGYKI